MKDKEILKIAEKEVKELVKFLDIDCKYDVEIEDGEEDMKIINISFEGEDLGYMIGNHGRHLDSLQYMVSLFLRKKFEEDMHFIVMVDVSGYRKERNSKIESIALRKADDARLLGEPVDLKPMKPSDRRIVHMVLQKFDDITTESQGEGLDRYVRIIPK
jgi:spoIIIJ-associated protein